MRTPKACPLCLCPVQGLDPRTEWPRFVAKHLAAVGLGESRYATGPVVLSPVGGLFAHVAMVHDSVDLGQLVPDLVRGGVL